MTALEKGIVEILTDDARITTAKIAAMLGEEESAVKACIKDMEARGLLVKYTAIVDGEKAEDGLVEALIEVRVSPKKAEGFDGIARQVATFPEVKGVYLMSGAYDLVVMIADTSLQKVARFVSERISTFDGVIGTSTHFILKKYKIEGVLTEREGADKRISVQP